MWKCLNLKSIYFIKLGMHFFVFCFINNIEISLLKIRNTTVYKIHTRRIFLYFKFLTRIHNTAMKLNNNILCSVSVLQKNELEKICKCVQIQTYT